MIEDAQLKLRVPAELKDFLEAEAKINHRTINGEVVYRLERSRLGSEYTYRITQYDGLDEPAITLELGPVTIGLMQSKYKEIKLERYNREWCLRYYGIRAMISDELAQKLITLGCDFIE
ncbi:Arc family DNA-binding protein [Acinetobacter brisouii]|uniref:Arc family DNA-binding protein n=1 Tax=Acinetobacter brisouii TaxID=396323 RepID=UPI0005F85B35|nr:Arc family DNA-binding protein [Acinetobacter brisouii]KJV37905.1 hypothetical protein VH98_11055 [Acinetobacter brisouii]